MIDKQKLVDDMKYLRGIYEWSDEDVIDIKREAKENPDWWTYWSDLADAHRAGYMQNAANNFIRLQVWREQRA